MGRAKGVRVCIVTLAVLRNGKGTVAAAAEPRPGEAQGCPEAGAVPVVLAPAEGMVLHGAEAGGRFPL